MIKKLFFLTALTFLAVSCTNEMDNALQQQRAGVPGPVFHAVIEDGDAQTKVFADDQMRVLWDADDRISIFNKTTANQQYRFLGETGDNAGDFQPVSAAASATAVSHIYAVYPYTEATALSTGGVVSLNLPDLQIWQGNSFGAGSNTMMSVTDDEKLLFRNVGGYLSFKLYGDGVSVKSITLTGNNHEKLAGAANITMDVKGTPATVMQQAATEAVTLFCPTPVALGATSAEYTEFWFVVPPTTFTKGFTITVTDDQDGVFEMSTAHERIVTRNTISRMSPVKVVPTPVLPAEGLYQNDNEIYLYDKSNSQVNIIEMEGNAWARFLYFPSLSMIEVGPIPVNAAVGDVFEASLSIFDEGVMNTMDLHFTVQAIQGGKISLVSDNDYRFIIRF